MHLKNTWSCPVIHDHCPPVIVRNQDGSRSPLDQNEFVEWLAYQLGPDQLATFIVLTQTSYDVNVKRRPFWDKCEEIHSRRKSWLNPPLS